MEEHRMDDLISRTMALDAVNHICPVDTEYDCTLLDRVDVRCVLLDLPPAERKRGKWITKSTNGEMFDVCSVCGYVEWDEPHKYCPNCGADMRGEEG